MLCKPRPLKAYPHPLLRQTGLAAHRLLFPCVQPQLAGALGHTQNALPLNDVLTNIGIDLGAVATFAFFFYKDWEVRLAGRQQL